jgi:hypothetical protein
MSRAAFALLGVAGAGLLGLVIWEATSLRAGDQDLPAATRRQDKADARSSPAEPFAGSAQQWAATTLARPLFSRTRRPPPDSGAGAGAGLNGLPRLTGILITEGGKRAIFAPESGKPIRAEEGGRVGQYVVQSIGAGRVTVAGPEGVRDLHLASDPKLRQSASAVVNQIRPVPNPGLPIPQPPARPFTAPAGAPSGSVGQ